MISILYALIKALTISLIKLENGKTFCGNTNLPWNSDFGFTSGSGLSFLFQLDQNTKHPCLDPQIEICGDSFKSIQFGIDDIRIYDNSQK
jgi:hypothetical protein